MSKNEKLALILKAHGRDSQIDQTIEECSELILALQKLKKHGFSNTVRRLQVNEEIADVSNMVEQLKMIFEVEVIEAFENEKIERELDRISKKQQHYESKTIKSVK